MSQAHTIEAIERGIHACLLPEIRSALKQIDGGKFPQYDDNCRRYIAELLTSLASDRDRQSYLAKSNTQEFRREFPPLKLDLRLHHLPLTATLGNLRSWGLWVELPTVRKEDT